MAAPYASADAGKTTYTHLRAHFPVDNPMGVEERLYHFMYGGFGPATDGAFLEDHEVGLCVKVSGELPGGRQKPEEAEYGRDSSGCQPHVVNWPIKHARFDKGIEDLLGMAREQMEQDRVVYFFCNRGDSRAATAVCVFLGWATGIHPLDWLPTVIADRNVAAWYYKFYEEFHLKKNYQWRPDNFDDWSLMCRFFHQDSSFRLWKELEGLTSSMPGTPRATELRYLNKAEQAAYSTTPPVTEEPLESTYAVVWGHEFDKLFRPDPAPGFVPPMLPKAPPTRPPGSSSPRQRGRSSSPRSHGGQRGRSPSPRTPREGGHVPQGQGLPTFRSKLIWDVTPQRPQEPGLNVARPPPPQPPQGGTPPHSAQATPRRPLSPPPGPPPASANHGQWMLPPQSPVRWLSTENPPPRSPRDASPHAMFKVGGISGVPAHFGKEGTPRIAMKVSVGMPRTP